MAYGLTHFRTTPAGVATRNALNAKASDVLAAARLGDPPILVIAALIEEHLGDRNSNAMVGRMIRDWLGQRFRVQGRKKWVRKHGTESGSFYAQR